MQRIVCLGDSITEGWPYQKEYSWIKQVQKKFPDLEIINSGRAGDMFSDMLQRVDRDVLSYRPDMCILMGGTNEAWQGISQQVLKKNFIQLSELLQEKCILVLGNPIPVIEDSVERYLDDVRKMLKEKVVKDSLETLDFFQHLSSLQEDIFAEYYLDGYHPNKKGYELMGCFAANRLDEILKRYSFDL